MTNGEKYGDKARSVFNDICEHSDCETCKENNYETCFIDECFHFWTTREATD